MELFSSDDLDSCLIDLVTFTKGDVGAEEVGTVVESLLQQISGFTGNHEESKLRPIAQYIKELAVTYPCVSSILLESLGKLKQPSSFLDVLPEIFSSATQESISELAQTLFNFATNDTLFVRSLEVLLQLPLGSDLSRKTANVARNAIHTVDLAEYPTLLRVTLKAANNHRGQDIIADWRKKLAPLEVGQLDKVMETLATQLPLVEKATREWLHQIENNFMLAVVDLSIILLSFSGAISSACSRLAKTMLHKFLVTGMFPLEAMLQVLPVGRRQEVWSRLHQPVWTLCVWLLESVVEYNHTSHIYTSPTPAITTSTTITTSSVSTLTKQSIDYQTLLKLLVNQLFSAAPTLQETITTCLIAYCFPQMQSTLPGAANTNQNTSVIQKSRMSPTKSTVNALEIPLPRLGSVHAAISHTSASTATTHSSYSEGRLHRRATYRSHNVQKETYYLRATTASAVLVSLCFAHSTVSEKIGHMVYDKVTQQLAENGKIFPSPVVCYRLIQGVAIRAATSTQQESALLILVQKLISSIGTTNTSLFEILLTSAGNRGASMQNSLFASKKNTMTAQQKVYRNSILPQQVYSASTFGILLAGQLLLREYATGNELESAVNGVTGGAYNMDSYASNGTSSSSSNSSSSSSNSATRQHIQQRIPPCSMQDRRALVNWITQCSSVTKDVSALYAIDILSTCLQRAIDVHFKTAAQDDHSMEWIYYVKSALQSVLEKVARSFGLTGRPCHQTLPDVTDFDYTVLELASGDPTEKPCETRSSSNIWSVSDLSTLLTQSAHATQLANNVRQNHVRFALHETVETCSSVFHLVQCSAYAHSLLHSTDLAYTNTSANPVQKGIPPLRVRLSYPTLHAATEMICDAAQSMTLLTTWSCGAADAFEGQYVLEGGCCVEQALKWAWERGFIVALLAGSAQALHQTNTAHSCDTLILQLLCQLHNSRYMLRAAHTKSILSKSRRSAANSSRTRTVKEESDVIGGYSARSAGTKRSASNASSSSCRGNVSKYSRNNHGGRNHATSAQSAKETAEFSEELQLYQRITLQRLLTRAIRSVPFSCLLSSLTNILHNSPTSTSSTAKTTTTTSTATLIPSALMTDAGLALVSQFVHRLSLQKASTIESVDSHNASDRFVSLSDLHHPPTATAHKTCISHPTVSVQDGVVIELIALLPALLDWLESSRTSLETIFKSEYTTTSSSTKQSTNAAACSAEDSGSSSLSRFGSTVNRQDGKILVLMILALFELQVHRVAHDQVLLKLLMDKLRAYEEAQELINKSDAQNSFAAYTTNADDLLADVDRENAKSVHLSVVYNALEKRLLQQLDCTVVSAGLRCLQLLLNSTTLTNNASTIQGASARVLLQRVASIGWSCTKNVFSESTYLAAQLLTSHPNTSNSCDSLHVHAQAGADIVVPGMDEMWPLLVHTTSHQHALHTSIVELTPHINRKTEGVSTLFKTVFNTHADLHNSHIQSAEHTLLSCAAYRQFYCVWWAAETSSERVYGVALVLREIFKFMFASSDATDSPNSAKKRKSGSNSKPSYSSDSEEDIPRSFKDKKQTKTTAAAAKPSSRKFAPEFLLMNAAAKTEQNNNKFGISFLAESTIEFHLSVMLPLLPALFLLAEPCADEMQRIRTENSSTNSGPSRVGNTPTAEAGPYVSFAHNSMLFLWLAQQVHTILDDEHTHLGVLLRTAPLLVKVCRAVLVAIDAAVATAATWRDAQPQIIDESQYLSETRTRDSKRSTPVDPGDMFYFEQMLQTALQVVQAVHTLGKALHTIFIASGSFELPKALIAAVPGLYNAAEVQMSRVLNVAKLHSIVLDTSSSAGKSEAKEKKKKDKTNPADQIGDKIMLQRMKVFLSRHDATVLNPLHPSVLQDIITESSARDRIDNAGLHDTVASHRAPHVSSHKDVTSDNDDADSDSENSSGFDGFEAVTGAAQGGWGLYSHTEDDNNSEYELNSGFNHGQSGASATSRGGRNSPGNAGDYQSDNSSVYSSYSAFDNESSSVVLSEYDDTDSDDGDENG